MAKGKQQTQQADGEVKDFSGRYPNSRPVDVQRGGWYEFAKVGDELVGEYLGSEPFRNGQKGTIKKPNGELVVFSIASQLRDLLREVKAGERIAIVLSGFQPTTSDKNPMKVFQVFRV